MIGNILFQVPDLYKSALISGEITCIGTLLKDSSTGKIIAHVQESGLASQVLNNLSGISPFEPLSSLSSISANIQLDQLKTLVEGLQVLQFATLGVSVVGIGINAIGFVLINKRLRGIEHQIERLEEQLDRRFRELSERDLRKQISRIQGLIERASQAHSLRNPDNEYMIVAGELTNESAILRGEIKHLLGEEIFDTELFTSLVSAMALCDAGRIECLMLSNELQAAHHYASDIAGNYSLLFDALSPVNLAAKVANPELHLKPDSYDELKKVQSNMKTLLTGIRDATDAAYTKPHLIETLMRRKIDGREYLQLLRTEKEQPLVLLAAE